MTNKITKPFFGDPCNQCGWCCRTEPCTIAAQVLPKMATQLQCPALTQLDDGRQICNVVANPRQYFKSKRFSDEQINAAIAHLLRKDAYCDAQKPSRWEEIDEHNTLTDDDVIMPTKVVWMRLAETSQLKQEGMGYRQTIAYRKARQLLQSAVIG